MHARHGDHALRLQILEAKCGVGVIGAIPARHTLARFRQKGEGWSTMSCAGYTLGAGHARPALADPSGSGPPPVGLFVAKIVSGAPGIRRGSLPPGPNNWMMELHWERGNDATVAFTTDPEVALRTVASKFAEAWLGGGFAGGVFYASIPLSARVAPRSIPPSKFFWQEPYHTPTPEASPGLEDAVLAAMLERI